MFWKILLGIIAVVMAIFIYLVLRLTALDIKDEIEDTRRSSTKKRNKQHIYLKSICWNKVKFYNIMTR